MGMFKKAVKAEAKLRMALAGPSGSGKTYTALALATCLAEGKPVAVIDTERGSASKYADLFEFDVLELDTFHPDRYVEAIHAAQEAGYGALVIDSLTHAWEGKGGLLEVVESIAKRSYNGNTFRAWSEGTPIQNRLIDAITGCRMHVIATMRTKNDYAVEKDERSGRMTPHKVGLGVKQREGMEYEFDIFGKMTPENELIVEKTRCPALTGAMIVKPGKPLADTLRAWLSGAPPSPTPTAAPASTSRPALRAVDPEPEPDETIAYTVEDEPAPEPPAAAAQAAEEKVTKRFATPDQWTRLRKACDVLGKEQPEPGTLTYDEAETLLSKYMEEWKKVNQKRVPSGRTRNTVSPLAATLPAGEQTPDLAELGTGTEGRH